MGLVSRQALNEYLDRELDSFLWMKTLAKEDILRELSAMRNRPQFKTEPWLHQLVCFYIALKRRRFLFLLDMGLGKSKILLDIITQRRRDKSLRRACITVPRFINIDSWRDGIAQHSHLEAWGIDVESIEEKQDRLLSPKGDISLIDYQGLQWALCEKVKAKKGHKLVWSERRVRQFNQTYNFIGLDESHKLGNHESLWHSLMWQICREMDYVYATTGTLFGKNPEAAWSQFYLVDRGETLGENLGLFREAFFTCKTTNWKVERAFNTRRAPELHRLLQNRSLRYDESEVHELPPRVMRPMHLRMGEEQREHYLRAVEGILNANGKLSELEAPWIRMRQICSGYLSWKDQHGDHFVPFKHNPKLDAIEKLVDNLGARKLVIAYIYRLTGKLISDRLTEMGVGHEWFYGGTKDKSASRRRFLEDPTCRVFVMNDEAGGTGTDGLQDVASYLAFYESPTSPTARQQVLKRVHRSGSPERVFIYDLAMKSSVDMSILQGAQDGRDIYEEVINGNPRSRAQYLL